ncbi:Biotin carboxyl carrier protein of acetyl-CoA carboxylase, partial [Tetrabaena socialis]
IGSFELKVRRSTAGHALAHAHAAPAAAAPAAEVPAAAPTAEFPAGPTPEDTVDESLVYVNSPKVGIFRRGKYAGGKRVGKGNLIDTGAPCKKGQTLGYVEQLGTFVEVKTPIAGELVKVHLEDGSPVEFQQLIAEVAPFFGGHIIGDSKYA